jgi:hypothetical protein
LKTIRNWKITYDKAKSIDIQVKSTAMQAGEETKTTGYLVMLNNGPDSWTSHKQLTVALSTMEAEYTSLSDATREVLARIQLFQDLGITINTL